MCIWWHLISYSDTYSLLIHTVCLVVVCSLVCDWQVSLLLQILSIPLDKCTQRSNWKNMELHFNFWNVSVRSSLCPRRHPNCMRVFVWQSKSDRRILFYSYACLLLVSFCSTPRAKSRNGFCGSLRASCRIICGTCVLLNEAHCADVQTSSNGTSLCHGYGCSNVLSHLRLCQAMLVAQHFSFHFPKSLGSYFSLDSKRAFLPPLD